MLLLVCVCNVWVLCVSVVVQLMNGVCVTGLCMRVLLCGCGSCVGYVCMCHCDV